MKSKDKKTTAPKDVSKPLSKNKQTLKEPHCTCGRCGEKIEIGEMMQYDKNYNTYCDNTYCSEGIATTGTCLESCWFG